MDIDNPEVNSGTAATQSAGDGSTKVATTAYVDSAVGAHAITLTGDVTGTGAGSFVATIKNGVALAGSPTTTTQSPGDSSTNISTTAYVDSAITAIPATQHENLSDLQGGTAGQHSHLTTDEYTGLSGLSNSRLAASDASGNLTSVSDLTSWIAGATNQITVTDDGDGTITLSTPQNLDTSAQVQFSQITVSNTGLHILDTNASHDLIIAPGSDLTADRTLTLTTGDAARTLTLDGNATLDDWFDQSVKTTDDVTFDNVILTTAIYNETYTFSFNPTTIPNIYTQYLGRYNNNNGVVEIFLSDSGSGHGSSTYARVSRAFNYVPYVCMQHGTNNGSAYGIHYRIIDNDNYELFFVDNRGSNATINFTVFIKSQQSSGSATVSAENDTSILEARYALVHTATNVLTGVGLNNPVSPLHIYEDSSNVGATAGLTIEQDGAGDAVCQFALTAGRRWVVGIDNSDSDNFKIANTADLNSGAVLTLTTGGNMLFGTVSDAGGTSGNTMIFGDNGGDPTAPANTAGFFAKDVTASMEMFAVDEADNVTQISPHDPKTGKWYYESVNTRTKRKVTVDLEGFFKHYDKTNGTNFFKEDKPLLR